MPRVKTGLGAAFVQGRKIGDKFFVVSIFDCVKAGMLVRAYEQRTGQEFTLSPTEAELQAVQPPIMRNSESYARLVASLDVRDTDSFGDKLETPCLVSSLPQIRDPKFIPQGDKARNFFTTKCMPGGAPVSLPDLLATGLTELCRSKPAGLDSVRWLGEWLLANNPNQPTVQ
jgi:hypothetical protein